MNCSICLKEMTEINKVITDCNHPFHLSCILKNFKINTQSGEKCPICRKSLLGTYTQYTAPHAQYIQHTQNIQQTAYTVSYEWPPIENNNLFEHEFNYQVFTRLKAGRYRNMSADERTRQISNYAYLVVSKYSFNKLKETLVQLGLSSRGYKRDSLENRLLQHMVLDTTGLIV